MYHQVMWLGMTTNERLNQARYMYMNMRSKLGAGKGQGHSHGQGEGHGHAHGGDPKEKCFHQHNKEKYDNPFQ